MLDDGRAALLASTIPARISRRAIVAPDTLALSCATHAISYRDLASRAATLAARMICSGVRAGDVVGVCLPRSIDEVVARLAVMQAGAAFLPLDPDWPAERVTNVLRHAGATLLVANASVFEAARAAGSGLLDPSAAPVDEPASSPVAIGPDDLAYVIFTSGSTGAPKCVELTHANLVHLVDWHLAAFAVTSADRASHVAGLAFDASVWEVWPYLCAGATVVLAPDEVRTDPALLRDWLVGERVTIGYVPTVLAQSMMRMAWPEAARLRHLLTGGEALRGFPVAGLPFAVTNCYGPSECTVVATAGLVPPAGASEGAVPTIGRPIAGAGAIIVDADGRPVPAGAAGELWITGAGVGRGYRGDPALTAERFVVLNDAASDRRIRAYRSGDQVRARADGEIEFIGRTDRQEKIRGVRVEADEIVAALNEHPQVTWSDVVGVGEGSERRLVAYILPDPARAPTAPDLRDFLAAKLPASLIPAAFLRLDALPLNGSGKLDRARLPDPETTESLASDGFRAPSTPTERRLAEIIGAILGIAEVGADDNFFLLGGHSLLGTRVVLQARAAFGVDLTLRHLFAAQTVAELATVIETMVLAMLAALPDEEAASLVDG